MSWKKRGGLIVDDRSANLVGLLSQRGVIAYDSFNRADNASSLGTADTGQNWQALRGTWGISALKGKLSTVTNDSAVVVDIQRSTNIRITADIVFAQGSSGAHYPGLSFFGIDANNFMFFRGNNGVSLTFCKRVNSVTTVIGSVPLSFSNGQQIRISVEVVGKNLNLFADDVNIGSITITDEDFAIFGSATKFGLSANNTINATFDNFIIDAI